MEVTPLRMVTSLFDGPGEIRALCRDLNWSATPLGSPDCWAPELRAAVRMALASPFPINLWCGPQRVLIYNDAYRPILGSKHPSALGSSGATVWAEIWPQIAPMFAQIEAGGPPIYAEDAPFLVEREGEPTRAPGEANAWFTFSLSPVHGEDGEIVAFLNVVSETTRRMRAEQAREAALAAAERAEARMRDAFSQAPAFLAILRGDDHVFEYVNDAYYQLVGHRPLVGLPVWEALPEVRGQGFEELLDHVLETGESYVGREVPVTVSRVSDGGTQQRYVDLVYYPISEADGTRSGVVAHGSDVTAHVLSRAEAQRARAAAEQASHAKTLFLASMSHEIRTPINAVIGYSDLLDVGVAGALNPAQQRYVDRILGSSRHLLALVNDVLDLAKIEADEMSVEARAVAAGEVVAPVIQLIAAQAESRGLTLRETWTVAPEVRFLGDEDRTRQILLNLLSNAIKFTSEGGSVTVNVWMSPEPEGGAASLLIEVEDTGSGIAPDQLDRIFEPFVQAESGFTRRVGGTGLGLTISRRFARMMGGDLTVSSSVGEGSRFTLRLPLESPSASE